MTATATPQSASFHPLDQLSAAEITAVATAVKKSLLANDSSNGGAANGKPRFNVITLAEPPKADLLKFQEQNGDAAALPRRAQVIFMTPESGAGYEAIVELPTPSSEGQTAGEITGEVLSCDALGDSFQPLLSPDDCELAEEIVKLDAGVARLLEERYSITDIGEPYRKVN